MALLEVNLEKPALIEEYQYPSEMAERRVETAKTSKTSESSTGGGKAKLVGLLAVVVGIGLLGWKLKNRGSGSESEQTDFEEEEYEHGPEPDIGAEEGGRSKRKVAELLGLVVAVASLAAAARKRRE